jgi:hypothetical protein
MSEIVPFSPMLVRESFVARPSRSLAWSVEDTLESMNAYDRMNDSPPPELVSVEC